MTTDAKTRRGFSLIEAVLYVVGISLVVGIVTYFIAQGLDLHRRAAAETHAAEVGAALADRLSKEIRTGRTVVLGESAFGVPAGSLTLLSFSEENELKKRFALENGRVGYSENGGPVSLLTPPGTSVSKLQFTQIETPVSYAVRYEIEVTYRTKEGEHTRSYPGLSVLRYSYE